MDRTALGVLLSFVFIAVVIAASKAFKENRKFVHIGVSNWFFIYYFLIEKDLWAILGLAVFSIINIMVPVDGDRKRSAGLFIYPLSVIAMIGLVNLGFGTREAVGCGLLGMGYGDGLAAVFGKKHGGAKVSDKTGKTWCGTLAMFIACIPVCIGMWLLQGLPMSALMVLKAVGISAVSTMVEAFSPNGLDNLTVPLLMFVMYVGLT